MDAALIEKLWQVAPVVAVLGFAAYRFMNKSDDSTKALIDFLANKNADMTGALKDAATSSMAVAKAVEIMAAKIEDLARKIEDKK